MLATTAGTGKVRPAQITLEWCGSHTHPPARLLGQCSYVPVRSPPPGAAPRLLPSASPAAARPARPRRGTRAGPNKPVHGPNTSEQPPVQSRQTHPRRPPPADSGPKGFQLRALHPSDRPSLPHVLFRFYEGHRHRPITAAIY